MVQGGRLEISKQDSVCALHTGVQIPLPAFSFLNGAGIYCSMAVSVNKILVPLDNSKNSFRGLSSAIYFAKMCNAKIIAVHAVYAPPKGDFDTSGHFNKDHKKQVKSMMEIAEKTM